MSPCTTTTEERWSYLLSGTGEDTDGNPHRWRAESYLLEKLRCCQAQSRALTQTHPCPTFPASIFLNWNSFTKSYLSAASSLASRNSWLCSRTRAFRNFTNCGSTVRGGR